MQFTVEKLNQENKMLIPFHRPVFFHAAHEGDVLTISYIHNADSGHPVANCQAGNGAGTILQLTTNDTTSESRVTYTVNSAHASNNVIDIRIPDWFVQWCDPEQHGSALRLPTFAGIKSDRHK